MFVKRTRAARLDLPALPFGPRPAAPGILDPDAHGRWGREAEFGGRYVPETLMAALIALEEAVDSIRHEPAFWAELRELGRRFIGRPTALYRADRLAAELERRAGRTPGSLRLYLKREDLSHTGAHKINNALGQALLTRRLGKSRVIAETGAGQHGVATATACALLDLECVVYMGAEDIRRQAPNVLRMRALGTEVREVTSGSATLKDAINEAMRDWVTNVATTHYVLGSAVGPHPYPLLVRDLQRVIGDEAATQMREVEGRLPDVAIACVGGGSNAIGLLSRFVGEPTVRLVGVEAAGEGLTGRHAAALAGGTPGVLHGSRSYLLQDDDGQVLEAHSISAGLDYPGIGPQLSAMYEAGRLEILSATDEEALDGVRTLTRTEGILPALEPAHAIAALGAWLAGRSSLAPLPDDAIVLLGLSGRGDKDLAAIADRLGVRRMTATAAATADIAGARRIGAAFRAAAADGRAALIPYAVAGYPDAVLSERIALGLIDSGADLLEFGLPYSDPLADGATLQRASGVALGAGATLDRSLRLMERVANARPATPIVGMGYVNQLLGGRDGGSILRRLGSAGVTGLILADLTPDEGAELQADAAAQGLAIVYLVTPTTTPDASGVHRDHGQVASCMRCRWPVSPARGHRCRPASAGSWTRSGP